MLYLENDKLCYLIEIADIYLVPEVQPDIVRENVEVLRQTITWVESFLCNPHPQLGRAGVVCPYTEYSMKNDYFWLTVCRGKELSINDVYKSVMRYRDWFLKIETQSNKRAYFKTMLILFPDIQVGDASKIVDTIQQKLKPEFVAKGLMIGQFHPSCPEPGLWNQDFRPLQSPVPMLAIRHMVLSDFPFLKQDERLISSYLKVFGDAIPQRVQEMIKG
ncbi:MAG: hypothetical protein NVSMB54_31460 [Ktedonobacteraceae bacterium]